MHPLFHSRNHPIRQTSPWHRRKPRLEERMQVMQEQPRTDASSPTPAASRPARATVGPSDRRDGGRLSPWTCEPEQTMGPASSKGTAGERSHCTFKHSRLKTRRTYSQQITAEEPAVTFTEITMHEDDFRKTRQSKCPAQGNSLAVQWLGLSVFTVGGSGSRPWVGRRGRDKILQASRKKKK